MICCIFFISIYICIIYIYIYIYVCVCVFLLNYLFFLQYWFVYMDDGCSGTVLATNEDKRVGLCCSEPTDAEDAGAECSGV